MGLIASCALVFCLSATAMAAEGGIKDTPKTAADLSGPQKEVHPADQPIPEPAAEEAEPAAPPTLADVKMNFVSVVETFIRQNSPDGFWRMKDSRTTKWFRLKLREVDKNSVAEAEGGLYKGRAAMVGLSGKPELQVEFAVDFSGLWSVKHYEVVSDEEQPEETGGPAFSPALFATLVKRHVRAASRKTGVFSLRDPLLKKRWRLKLKSIHSDRLVALTEDRYFGCADFTEALGRARLDLDFYVKKKASGWAVDEVVLHAVDDKPRFTYDETNQRLPVPVAAP